MTSLNRSSVEWVPDSGAQSLIGYRVVEWREGYAALELDITPQHLNRNGVIHGGILATLLDSAMSLAGLYCSQPGQMRTAATLSLSTDQTGHASKGVVRASGQLRSSGRRIFSCTGEVQTAEGEVIAIGQGTFRAEGAVTE